MSSPELDTFSRPDVSSLAWFEDLKKTYEYKHVQMREWNDLDWRNGDGGFLGRDFCHSPDASVQILDYILLQNENTVKNGLKLIGPVYFSPKAESHRGLCHGGSMCAVIDDVLGWMGFCSSGEILPWSGYTVQVNTSLKKSVTVGSVLRLEAWIDRFEGNRKVWIETHLIDAETNEIYCKGTGLFLKSL